MAKTGAVAYMLWGVLHVIFGGMFLYGALAKPSLIAEYGFGDAGANALGFFAQHGFNLLWVGIFATVVGATLNWKNSATGFWVNGVVVSLFDIGFIVFVLIPGHIAVADGLMGPVLWIIALATSAVAYRSSRGSAQDVRAAPA